MTSNKLDLLYITFILILVICNIAICLDFKNGDNNNLVINITSDYLILYPKGKNFISLILSKYSLLKFPTCHEKFSLPIKFCKLFAKL